MRSPKPGWADRLEPGDREANSKTFFEKRVPGFCPYPAYWQNSIYTSRYCGNSLWREKEEPRRTVRVVSTEQNYNTARIILNQPK